MPRVVPVLPSQDEKKLQDQFKTIMEAAAAVDLPLDMHGLAKTWLADTSRLVIAYEGDTPTGIGFMVTGRRWFDDESSASVLFSQGTDSKAVLEYLRETAIIMGCVKFFYEGDALGGELSDLRMLRLRE